VTPFAPATVRIEFIDGLLPSDDLVREPDPAVRADVGPSRKPACLHSIKRGAADRGALSEIRRAAFDEGLDAPSLSRRYREVAFPVSEAESGERLRRQIAACARRLAQLVAEAGAPVPRRVAAAVEEAVGQLLEALED